MATTVYVCSNPFTSRHFEVPCSFGVLSMSKQGASHVERDQCPVYAAIQVIEGRWKPMIFRRLGDGALGFGELRRTMPGVTIKVLRQHLRQLEADGVVARSVLYKPALGVRYRLTQHGQTLGGRGAGCISGVAPRPNQFETEVIKYEMLG